MQFSTIAMSALVAAFSVTANPVVTRATEHITVTSMLVNNFFNRILSTEFTIQPDNVTCRAVLPDLTSTFGCDVDNWTFRITENSFESYLLSIAKQTGVDEEISGEKNVTLACESDGAEMDYTCSQPANKVFSIALRS